MKHLSFLLLVACTCMLTGFKKDPNLRATEAKLKTIWWEYSNGRSDTVHLFYNAQGYITEAKSILRTPGEADKRYKCEYFYDTQNRVVKCITYDPDLNEPMCSVYVYDKGREPVKMVLNKDRATDYYEYVWKDGRLVSSTMHADFSFFGFKGDVLTERTFTYDPAGRLTQTKSHYYYPPKEIRVQQYSNHVAGRTYHINLPLVPYGTSILGAEVSYVIYNAGAIGGKEVVYEYDAEGYPVAVTTPGGITYHFLHD